MYQFSDIRQLHLELSTQCNAECPMCARNFMGTAAPGLVETSMSLDQFKSWVPRQLLEQLQTIDVCGAYGDPALATDLPAICRYIRTVSTKAEIRIYTNGGVRTQRWWADLASIAGLSVIFAIDGVETNSHYRRHVDTAKVFSNAEAFIAARGNAQWDFIVFAHNEHEVEVARQLAYSMGFTTFAVKKTARFLRPLYEPAPELRADDGIEVHPIYDREGRVVDELRPPRIQEYVNEVLLWARRVEARAEYFDQFFDTCTIQCIATDSASVYMSATGAIYPCCWLYVQATLPMLYRGAAQADLQVAELLASCGGPERLSAATHSIADIIQGPFFEAVVSSWQRTSVRRGRLMVCARVCGDGFGAYRKQFAAPELVP